MEPRICPEDLFDGGFDEYTTDGDFLMRMQNELVKKYSVDLDDLYDNCNWTWTMVISPTAYDHDPCHKLTLSYLDQNQSEVQHSLEVGY